MVSFTRKTWRFVIFLAAFSITFLVESTLKSTLVSASESESESVSEVSTVSSDCIQNSSSIKDVDSEVFCDYEVDATSLVHVGPVQKQDDRNSFDPTIFDSDLDDQKDQKTTTETSPKSFISQEMTTQAQKEIKVQVTTPSDSTETHKENPSPTSPQSQSQTTPESESEPEPINQVSNLPVNLETTQKNKEKSGQNPTTFFPPLFSQLGTNDTETENSFTSTSTSTEQPQNKSTSTFSNLLPLVTQNVNSTMVRANLNKEKFPPSTKSNTTAIFHRNSSAVVQNPENVINKTNQVQTSTQNQTPKSTLSTTGEIIVGSQTPTPTQIQSQTQTQSTTSDSNLTNQKSPSFNTTNPNPNSTQNPNPNSSKIPNLNATYQLNYSCSFKSSRSLCENVTTEIPNLSTEKERHGFYNRTPNFFIHPKNVCIKNMTIEICRQEIKSASTRARNSTIKSASVVSEVSPTLQKCCPMGGILTMNTSRKSNCKSSRKPPWKPGNFGEEIHPNYNVGGPCDSFIYILPRELEPKIHGEKYSQIKFKDVQVLANGGVELRESENHNGTTLEENTYCIDGFYHANLTKDSVESFMVLRCAPEEFKISKIKDLIYTVTSFISSFVLLIIVVVYILVWDKQNIHGWTKCAFSLAMFFWLFCPGVRLVYRKKEGKDEFCVFIAVATLFFRIFVFSWMIMMNFDLWSTISSMTAKSQRSKGHKRFLCYCCVALAIPAILVTISLIIDNQLSSLDDSVIRPQFGATRCYLDKTAVKAYAIYPTLILFLLNLIFILLTLKFLMDGKREGMKFQKNSDWKATVARNKKDRDRMVFYIKLFIIMGISWIFEIISGLLDADAGEVSWYWMIPDIYNILQSFLLFWLFIYRKTIRDQLSEKYSFFKVGFKWMDVHSPRFSLGSKKASGQRDSQSQSPGHLTKSTGFRSRDENFA